MKNSQGSSIIQSGVIGSIIVAIFLVLGTFWTGQNASRDTEKAVHTVSLRYLGELSERREQVVASTLQGFVSSMDVAIGLLTKEDLQSVASLQAYQARMKQLYHLEKFAFVDSDGLIYTSRGTRTDIDQYPFNFHTLSSPEVGIKNPESSNKKIIVAVPVDRLPFAGTHLVVCFMEIDMHNMLKNISLVSNISSTTVCNLYTNTGISLTDTVLGGLLSDNNLLRVLEKATFDPGSSLENMRKDFRQRRAGVVTFTFDGIRETMSYVPVHGTSWMLTYLVRESVISDEIRSISQGIVSRSLALSVATVCVLAILFAVMIVQIRRTAKVVLDREVQETENRIKREELEEQLALQKQLLAKEQERIQQDRMITALAADYRGVYYVNLRNDSCICYRWDEAAGHTGNGGEPMSYLETFRAYAMRYVTEAYREGFLAFIDPEAIRAGLSERTVLTYRYIVRRNDQERYEMLRVVQIVEETEETEEARVKDVVGVGFTDIDAETRDDMRKSHALSEALSAAEEANKAKTVFLSNMSHEIRTPMNAIIGLDNLALNDPDLSGKTRDYLKKIGSSAQHLLSLINDILDMSRIESGRMIFHNEEFDFAKLIEQINTIFSAQCQDKGLTYTCNITGSVDSHYIGDSIKIRQVLINILGNAVKFTNTGHVDLLVEKISAFDGKSTLRFTIKDTGIGISKEYLPTLFDAFTQETLDANNKYGSSGLGMAITKNIVDMMNGQISVASEKGVGTTFTVTVTFQDVGDLPSKVSDGLELNPADISVLVVDDDAVACEHAKLELEKIGIASEIAPSGQKAVEMVKLRHARREPYNVIIIDWQMPEMNGVEATRQIRQIIGSESAIIILTAYNWDDVLNEALDAGVDSFVAKPLFSGTVLEELKAVLQKKRVSEQETRTHVDLTGKRVLLAEDILINAEIIIQVLEMRGMETEHAENGQIAVDMFANHPEGYYDVILMDMRMPVMTGLEATVAIRAMERSDAKTIPIIALTANAFDEDVQRSLQAGLNAHLSKPVNPDVLFETLESML